MTTNGTSERRGRRLLVVDDHPVVCMGMQALLSAQPWVQSVAVAHQEAEALSLLPRQQPTLALVDLFVGEESGIDIARALRGAMPHLKVILMSGSGRVSRAVARSAGAVGFIAKDTPPAMIVQLVQQAHAEPTGYKAPSQPVPKPILSRRQLDVLHQLAKGASNPEAAIALHLSPHTVKQHTQVIYQRLGVRNRAEAVGRAQRMGLIA